MTWPPHQEPTTWADDALFGIRYALANILLLTTLPPSHFSSFGGAGGAAVEPAGRPSFLLDSNSLMHMVCLLFGCIGSSRS